MPRTFFPRWRRGLASAPPPLPVIPITGDMCVVPFNLILLWTIGNVLVVWSVVFLRTSTHGKLTYRAGSKSGIRTGPVGLHPNASFVFMLDAWKSALTK